MLKLLIVRQKYDEKALPKFHEIVLYEADTPLNLFSQNFSQVLCSGEHILQIFNRKDKALDASLT
ncbi:hypothetical protein ABTP39_19035, partial [Acinetobacter baumannii]